MQEIKDFQAASIEFLNVLGEYVRPIDYVRVIIKFDDDTTAIYSTGCWQIFLPSGVESFEQSPHAVMELLS